jgi:CRISPR-associated protein Cas5t
MIRLRVKAPFAAFHTFAAGAFRPTAPFLTPSAAYGLVLNIAAIDSRRDDEHSATTLTAVDLPPALIALGAITIPSVQTLYQQLHNYPVGSSGADRAAYAHGTKYNIQPVRREVLLGLDAYVCLDGNTDLEDQVRIGLTGATPSRRRYGLPFLGDNNFIISVLREEANPIPAHWFRLAQRGQEIALDNPCRLTVWIDREDASRTEIRLYTREETTRLDPTPDAWTSIMPRTNPQDAAGVEH